MTDNIVERLRGGYVLDYDEENQIAVCKEAADRIETLLDTVDEMVDRIARIQNINMRRDMNQEQRTIEIDRLCKLKKNA